MRVILAVLVFVAAMVYSDAAAALPVVGGCAPDNRCTRDAAYKAITESGVWACETWHGSSTIKPVQFQVKQYGPDGNGEGAYAAYFGCYGGPDPNNQSWYSSTNDYFDAHFRACPSGTQWNEDAKTCDNLSCGVGEWPDPANPGQCLSADKCKAKNGAANGFPETPTTRPFKTECVGGCEFALTGGGIGIDGDYAGVFQFTGASCPANKPPKPDDTEKNAPQEKCTDLGEGYKSCLRADGQQCVTMKSGKASCWSPGETGTKTDGEAAQKRDAGNTPVPPNTQLPNGDTLVQTGPTTTTTTTKVDKNGNTTNITTVTHNYGTQHGTNAGTKNEGTTNTAAATNGGTSYAPGGGGGGDEEGDEDKGSVTGGGNCESQPQVSGGDPLLANIVLQTWGTRCAAEDENAVTSSGEIGDCKSPFTVSGPPGDANVLKLKAARAEICPNERTDAEGQPTTDNYLGEEGGVPDGVVGGEKEYGADGLDSVGLGWSRSCPKMPTVNVFGTTVDFAEWSIFCTLFQISGQFVLILAALASLRIIGSGNM